MASQHYQAGERLSTAGERSEAVEEYRKALLFSPDNTDYRVSLARALIDDGRLDEAQSHLEQLLQEDPTNGILNLMLARIALARRHSNQAIAYYERAVYEYWPTSQLPERRTARWELIDLLSGAGRRNEAVAELMQLYANTSNTNAEKSAVGFRLLNYAATSEALQVFRDILRVQPDNPEAHRGLAEAYFASGDYVSARHEFQRAVHLNVADHESLEDLALDNSVIDLDPALGGITAAERLRRSENLLRRMLAVFDSCQGQNAADVRLAEARKLLNGKHPLNSDAGLAMQQDALALWSNRAEFCSTTPSDRALETVLARLARE